MPRARTSTRARTTGKARSSSQTTFRCPECGRTFARAASLGAHRRQAHGVAGSSPRARSNAARANRTRAQAMAGRRGSTRRGGAPSTGNATPRTRSAPRPGNNRSINRDQLLRAVFPNGVPAREDVIRSVNSWLDEAERLARLR